MQLDDVEEFLNTVDERTFSVQGVPHVPSDSLTSTADLSAWLGAHDHPGPVRPADLDAARDLRSALRGVLRDDVPAARALERFPLQLVPDGAGGLRVVASTGVAGLDDLVATVATSVAAGSWRRMKLCASPDCRWAFHDTSRNGAGRWCSMNACGNRHKTRAYRQRRS